MKSLLNVSEEAAKDSGCGVVTADVTTFPGMVRASFGCYSNEGDVDALVEMLAKISRDECKGKYVQDPVTGRFSAQEYTVSLKRYFPYLVSETPYEREYSEST